MRFCLSNRQKKELDNGKLIRVALPHPDEDVDDYTRYASVHLDVDASDIRDARPGHVRCFRGTDPSPVADAIGMIAREQDDLQGRLLYRVEVVIVDLCRRPIPRGEYPVQWPKDWM